MTVKEAIIKLNILNITDKLEKMEQMGAPKVVIDNLRVLKSSLDAGTYKVNGLARKYKAKADLVIDGLYQADTFTYDYTKGRVKTVAMKMVVAGESWYYDYYENKFGKATEMGYSAEGCKWEVVTLD